MPGCPFSYTQNVLLRSIEPVGAVTPAEMVPGGDIVYGPKGESMEPNVPGHGIPQHCIYCSQGTYQVVAENLAVPDNLGTGHYLGITLTHPYSRKWLFLECDNCGNFQIFRRGGRDKPFPWDPPPKDLPKE